MQPSAFFFPDHTTRLRFVFSLHLFSSFHSVVPYPSLFYLYYLHYYFLIPSGQDACYIERTWPRFPVWRAPVRMTPAAAAARSRCPLPLLAAARSSPRACCYLRCPTPFIPRTPHLLWARLRDRLLAVCRLPRQPSSASWHGYHLFYLPAPSARNAALLPCCSAMKTLLWAFPLLLLRALMDGRGNCAARVAACHDGMPGCDIPYPVCTSTQIAPAMPLRTPARAWLRRELDALHAEQASFLARTPLPISISFYALSCAACARSRWCRARPGRPRRDDVWALFPAAWLRHCPYAG